MAMRILLVNKTDQAGGAARAAFRFHQGLRAVGHDSWFLVDEKTGNDPYTISPKSWFAKKRQVFAARLERKAERLLNKSGEHHVLSQGYGTDYLKGIVKDLKPDIINLHWVNRGQIDIKTLKKLSIPIVWTLHDMWPFTGNCHYSDGCNKYVGQCGACPQLGSSQQLDASREVWLNKRKEWQGVKLSFISPSQWLKEEAENSSLVKQLGIKTSCIPNGLDLQVFKPMESSLARVKLKLPVDVPLLLFGAVGGADDVRKGSSYLIKALQNYRAWMPEDLELVVFGGDGQLRDLDYPIHYLGKLTTDSDLVAAYSAANAFVAPSKEDNLPNTVLESMACGTPVASFDIGGLPDMVIPNQTGFLAPPFEPEALAKAIVLTLAKSEELGHNARMLVTKDFEITKQANMYYRHFHSVLYGNRL